MWACVLLCPSAATTCLTAAAARTVPSVASIRRSVRPVPLGSDGMRMRIRSNRMGSGNRRSRFPHRCTAPAVTTLPTGCSDKRRTDRPNGTRPPSQTNLRRVDQRDGLCHSASIQHSNQSLVLCARSHYRHSTSAPPCRFITRQRDSCIRAQTISHRSASAHLHSSFTHPFTSSEQRTKQRVHERVILF